MKCISRVTTHYQQKSPREMPHFQVTWSLLQMQLPNLFDKRRTPFWISWSLHDEALNLKSTSFPFIFFHFEKNWVSIFDNLRMRHIYLITIWKILDHKILKRIKSYFSKYATYVTFSWISKFLSYYLYFYYILFL